MNRIVRIYHYFVDELLVPVLILVVMGIGLGFATWGAPRMGAFHPSAQELVGFGRLVFGASVFISMFVTFIMTFDGSDPFFSKLKSFIAAFVFALLVTAISAEIFYRINGPCSFFFC